MKYLLVPAIIIMLTASAYAQQQMSPEMMEMMQKIQSMTPEQQAAFMADIQAKAAQAQQCHDSVGEAELERLQQQTTAFNTKVKNLCTAGERDAAKRYADAAALRMNNDPAVQQLKACSKGLAEDMMKYTGINPNDKTTHICD